ncbi:MAG: hypothetical protein U5Q03_17480 [Bacteroidota bacterium]|nr:hypothetical protein [Bacteroidota bacterium]
MIDSNNQIRRYDFDPEKEEDPFNGVFIMQQQVGIRKDYQGRTGDEAYYMQTSLKNEDKG